jgi:HPt (histidine-containing phosphotransfer) domain-containing protein
LGLKKVYFLPTPIHSLSLADFFNAPAKVSVDSVNTEAALKSFGPEAREGQGEPEVAQVVRDTIEVHGAAVHGAAVHEALVAREEGSRLASQAKPERVKLERAKVWGGGVVTRDSLCDIQPRLDLLLHDGQDLSYRDILKEFLRDAAVDQDYLNEAFLKGDLQAFETRVHALKGAVYIIGARNLANLAGDLEEACRYKDSRFIKAKAPLFSKSLATVTYKIKQYLSEYEVQAGAGVQAEAGVQTDSEESHTWRRASLDSLELSQELRKLAKAFKEIDPKAISRALSSLKANALTPELERSLDQITDCFFDVEYEEAVSLIDDLLGGLSAPKRPEYATAEKLLN